MEKMKAVVYTEYGGPEVLHPADVEKPDPKDNEVLIRIHAVSVNYGDIIVRNFKNVSPGEFNMPLLFWLFARFDFGFSKPRKKILGNSFAGEVELIGSGVSGFKKGDLVFGYTGESMGAYAEFICIPESGILSPKPSNMTFAEASAVPYGALTALNLLRKVNLQKIHKVLIIGASGSIGSAALQLFRNYYKAEVSAVCSAEGMEYVKKLGVDKVFDYGDADFAQSGNTYDLIFDILGKGTFSHFKDSLNKNGIYFSVSFKTKKLMQMLWTSITGGKKVVCALADPGPQDLIFIKELAEDGKIKSIICKSFLLEQAADAHKYIMSGVKKGNVVLQVE